MKYTREMLELEGFRPMTRIRGGGTYSNDIIGNRELADQVWNQTILELNQGITEMTQKPLLDEVHIYCKAMEDNYRGTEITRYLCKQK